MMRVSTVLACASALWAVAAGPAAAEVVCEVTVGLTNSVSLGALQYDISYPAAVDMTGQGADAECTDLSGAATSFNDYDSEGFIRVAHMTLTGIDGPTSVIRCALTAESTPLASDFSVTVTDATATTSGAATATVAVESLVCSGGPTTTTTTTLASFETCTVTFEHDNPASLSALQFAVDVSSAPGSFEASGGTLDCEAASGWALATFNVVSATTLHAALVSLSGVSGTEAAACSFYPVGRNPTAADFTVTVADAAATDESAVGSMSMAAVVSGCGSQATTTTTTLDVATTTTTTSTTTSTLDSDYEGTFAVLVDDTVDDLGALGLTITYDPSLINIPGEGAEAACTLAEGWSLGLCNDNGDTGSLKCSLISLFGIDAPATVLTCSFGSSGSPSSSDFTITADDASTVSGTSVLPLGVSVVVVAGPEEALSCGDGIVSWSLGEACDDANNSDNDTCLSTCAAAECGDAIVCSDSSCTSGPGGGQEECDEGASGECTFTLSTTGSGLMEALQVIVDYGSAGGVFEGTGAGVACSASGGFASGVTLFNDQDTASELIAGFTSLSGVAVGSEVANCTFVADSAPSASDFTVTIDDLSGTSDVTLVVSLICATGGTETCNSDCSLPVCGDGKLNTAFGEECDDGNDSNDDGCVGFDTNGDEVIDLGCVSAVCGDGYLCSSSDCSSGSTGGTEACDDGGAGVCSDDATVVCTSTSDCSSDDATCDTGGDSCLDTCAVAACGDGSVCAGSDCTSGPGAGPEDCDAGSANSDAADGDSACLSDCSGLGVCGDTNGDGSIKASDALLALKYALRIPVSISFWNANVNADGAVKASDALNILKKALKINVDLTCGDRALVLSADDAVSDLAVMTVIVDYSGTGMTVVGEGESAANLCTLGYEGAAITLFNNDVDTSTLLFGVVSLRPLEFEAGSTIFSCPFRELDSSPDVDPALTIDEAFDSALTSILDSVGFGLSY